MNSDLKHFTVKKLHPVLIAFIFLSLHSNAQKGWEAGGWGGVSHYFGDLNTTFDIKKPGLAAGVVARYNFNDRICAKMSANYGTIGADDKNSENIFNYTWVGMKLLREKYQHLKLETCCCKLYVK